MATGLNSVTDLLNAGEPCLAACDQLTGHCPHYCGRRGACCQSGGAPDAPAECGHGTEGCLRYPCCSRALSPPPAPPPPELRHAGTDCWAACSQRQGACAHCGARGACCRGGFPASPAECGYGTLGCLGDHCCTLMHLPPLGPPQSPSPHRRRSTYTRQASCELQARSVVAPQESRL